MLTTLRIKNLALVDDLSLDLTEGYTALTGETGAGKSIILGAIKLLLGQKADRTLIRTGADSCTVEAVFSLGRLDKKISDFLDECGIEKNGEGELFLKRTFSSNGGNKQFINGSPANLALLQTLGAWLVDMHGPHDHQSLFHPGKQLEILDAYANTRELCDTFEKLFRDLQTIESRKKEFSSDEKTYVQQLDLLAFQSGEIFAARLREGEDLELEDQFQKARNATRLATLVQSSLEQLSEQESSVIHGTQLLGKFLFELQKLDAPSGLHDGFRALQESLEELRRRLENYRDGIDASPERFAELEERLDLINGLKRKYGPSLAEVLEFGAGAASRLKKLQDRDEELAMLEAEKERKLEELKSTGRKLTDSRAKATPQLAEKIRKELGDLGFLQSIFSISLTTQPPEAPVQSTGYDLVEFLFSPNPGEPAKPLKAIASSGEMARVMLAIKTVLAREDEVPVLVFDEVDANVGGQTARVVGEKMRQIARQRQVLCITHLAPVAASANHHFLVKKEIRNGRTLSSIELISDDARVEEIARMLGGLSAGALKHASELLASVQK